MEETSAFGVGSSVDGYNKQSQNAGEDNSAEAHSQKEPPYSMPGVLHFLQTEWSKVEMERSQWEVERAELQARIAFLQGERKGQENLKHDLVRRIKMLEFALRQERAKFHRLKYGAEPATGGSGAATATADDVTDGGESANSPSLSQCQSVLDPEELLRETSAQTAATKAKAKDGRQLIRQYLQEIGFVDSILDARQARLQQLIGASGSTAAPAATSSALAISDSNQLFQQQQQQQQQQQRPLSQQQQPPPPSHQQHQPTQQMGQLNKPQQQQQPRGRTIQEQLSSLIPGINIAGEDDDEEDDAEEEDEEDGGGRLRRGGGKAPLSEEEQVIAEFDFLVNQQDAEDPSLSSTGGVEDSTIGEADAAADELVDAEWSMDDRTRSKVEAFKKERIRGPKKSGGGSGGGSGTRGMLDAFLDEFGGRDGGDEGVTDDIDSGGKLSSSAAAAAAVAASEEEGFRSAMGLSLGDLQDITVANERDYDDDVGTGADSSRRTWTAKFSLRSHLDGVRAVAFHPTDSALFTASEDGTLKLWNLAGKAAALHQDAGSPNSTDGKRVVGGASTVSVAAGPQVELEPVHTYRGHAGPILAVCVSPDGSVACTGGLDGCVRVWRLPPTLAGLDQYDAYDSSLVGEALEGHQDAVWGLAATGSDTLFSVSPDSTLRAWRISRHGHADAAEDFVPLLRTVQLNGLPTALTVVPADPGKLLVAMKTTADSDGTASSLLLVDAETGQTVMQMQANDLTGSPTRVVAHPTQPTAIAGYTDRCIRCFDYTSGEITHSMVAHLDSVTSLAIDPNGLYLASGSHDASVRIWSLDDPRACVQEIAAHRRKFDEAVHDVALHPTKSLMASAGADALAKVFV